MPRAAQCLEGRWARCRRQPTAIHPRGRATTAAPGRISPSEGENAAWCSGHGPPAQADGRGPPPAASPARHVVLCGHRSVFSSPPGRRMFRLLTFFHEPSVSLFPLALFWHPSKNQRLAPHAVHLLHQRHQNHCWQNRYQNRCFLRRQKTERTVHLYERVCCLLVLNLVSSTLPCIRQPRPRLRVLDICGFVLVCTQAFISF